MKRKILSVVLIIMMLFVVLGATPKYERQFNLKTNREAIEFLSKKQSKLLKSNNEKFGLQHKDSQIQLRLDYIEDTKQQLSGVNDVLQCPEIDGTNCPKTDVFPVQNEKGGSFPASLRFYKSTWYVSFFLR